jgi:hypothetical protein
MRPATVDRRGRHLSRFSRSRSASCGALSRTRLRTTRRARRSPRRGPPRAACRARQGRSVPSLPHALERRRRADARTGQPCTGGGAGIRSQSDQSRNARTATGSPGRRPTATTPVALMANGRCGATRGPRLAFTSARVSRGWCRACLCPRKEQRSTAAFASSSSPLCVRRPDRRVTGDGELEEFCPARCTSQARGGVCCGRSTGGPACRTGRGRGWRRCGEGRCGCRSRGAVARRA